MFGCCVDTFKAFDTVEHTLLLDKLLKRNLPICVVRFLLSDTTFESEFEWCPF